MFVEACEVMRRHCHGSLPPPLYQCLRRESCHRYRRHFLLPIQTVPQRHLVLYLRKVFFRHSRKPYDGSCAMPLWQPMT